MSARLNLAALGLIAAMEEFFAAAKADNYNMAADEANWDEYKSSLTDIVEMTKHD